MPFQQIQTSAPKCFVAVDVPYSGDDALIHENRFDVAIGLVSSLSLNILNVKPLPSGSGPDIGKVKRLFQAFFDIFLRNERHFGEFSHVGKLERLAVVESEDKMDEAVEGVRTVVVAVHEVARHLHMDQK